MRQNVCFPSRLADFAVEQTISRQRNSVRRRPARLVSPVKNATREDKIENGNAAGLNGPCMGSDRVSDSWFTRPEPAPGCPLNENLIQWGERPEATNLSGRGLSADGLSAKRHFHLGTSPQKKGMRTKWRHINIVVIAIDVPTYVYLKYTLLLKNSWNTQPTIYNFMNASSGKCV